MKKNTALAVAFITIFLCSFTNEKTTSEFQKKLLEAKMSFNMPEGYKEVPIIKNMQMNYEFAIKNIEKDFEVRYAIQPLADALKNHQEKEKNKKEDEINLDPNTLHKATFLTVLMNISGVMDLTGGKTRKISTFPAEAIKAELNADWGAMTLIEVRKEFAQDYKYCMPVTIHKDDAADAYFFYLANDQQTIIELMHTVFHSLKFN